MIKLKNSCAPIVAIAFTINLVLMFASGAEAADAPSRATLSKWMESYRRPGKAPAPSDNPITPEKVALGKSLFFDPRLSGSGTISCGSCHNPALGWQDGLKKAEGFEATHLGRHSPTILDVAWAPALFWDGRAGSLEEQAKGPMLAAGEMNAPAGHGIDMVASIKGYLDGFATAYPGQPIDVDHIAKAIATYERTVISGEAPFDRWIAGDDRAISDSAKRGFFVFNTTGNCAVCHAGWRFSDDGFHDIGLPSDDPGRGKIVPGVEVLDHAFKTPTLRNIADRPPYMHDGSIATLMAVIDHYDHGFVQRPSLSTEIRPLHLSQQDKEDLAAFMQTLTSHDEAVNIPTLPR